jgi:hypothetical protein
MILSKSAELVQVYEEIKNNYCEIRIGMELDIELKKIVLLASKIMPITCFNIYLF